MKEGARENPPICGVLLAGGRGTRFWPRSRLRTPKQLLNIAGRDTMLRETAARLKPLISERNIWVVTNAEQAATVRAQLSRVRASHVLAEPIGRNTAAAIGLTAFHLVHEHGDALMAVLPADSHVRDAAGYRRLMRGALELVRERGKMAVFGIVPAQADVGYGYIETGKVRAKRLGVRMVAARRFTEKPPLKVARKYVASGKYLWNAGMFFWRASTFLDALRQFLPATHAALNELAASIGTKRYAAALRRIYPRLQNISVDYAIMEPATRVAGEPRVFVVPAKVGWSDIGSWASVYEFLASRTGANISAGPFLALDADGNYFWSPKKFTAAVGVRDLVVVETDDALLVCARNRAHDVGKIVKWLEERKRKNLL
ncbi:MAG: mannose-1-phosphate guanylyltransferase [Acidobacteriota bacterium]|nr:mannose-1-phosphate guanylyltransferase [Acidobacteriota bacterium]